MDRDEEWLKTYVDALMQAEQRRLNERFVAQERALEVAANNAKDSQARLLAFIAFIVAVLVAIPVRRDCHRPAARKVKGKEQRE